MTQPLLHPQANLHYFQFNNEERTVIDLSKFTLIRADKIGIASGVYGFCLDIFCSSCVREGRMRLNLKDIATNQSSVQIITYDYERDLTTDLGKIRTAFREVTNRLPIEGASQ